MVCEDCRKKSEKSEGLVTPEFTKGSSHYKLASSNGERKVNQNMILNKRKFAFDPMTIKCLVCRSRVEGKNKYCLTCAYTKGLCETCGKQLSNMKAYKFTDVDPKDVKRKNKMILKTKAISDQILESKKMKDLCDANAMNKARDRTKTIVNKDEIDFTKNVEDLSKRKKEKILDKLNNENDEEYDEIIKI